MKALIKNQQATIDGQLYEAPGIEEGECECEFQWQYKDIKAGWITEDEEGHRVSARRGYPTRQILVKQEGEEKAETVEEAAQRYSQYNKQDFIAGSNWQSDQQSKRIAELEGALNIMICGYYDGLSEEDLLACEKALKGEGE